MSLAPGTRLASYEIVALLGAGGMGEVYRARDARLRRDVALKVIAASSDEDARRRVLSEARAAAAVSHPNICQIFEIGEEQDTLFITMELLTGETLADRILRGPLATSQAIPLAIEALTALQVIHEQGLIHRDLKPGNIFLTPHGVKILDFGLARPVSVAVDPSVTQTDPFLTWLRANKPALKAQQAIVPKEFLAVTSSENGSRIFLFQSTVDDFLVEQAVNKMSCAGCHTTETNSAFTHVGERWHGTGRAKISEFLRQELPKRAQNLWLIGRGQLNQARRTTSLVH